MQLAFQHAETQRFVCDNLESNAVPQIGDLIALEGPRYLWRVINKYWLANPKQIWTVVCIVQPMTSTDDPFKLPHPVETLTKRS